MLKRSNIGEEKNHRPLAGPLIFCTLVNYAWPYLWPGKRRKVLKSALRELIERAFLASDGVKAPSEAPVLTSSL